LRQRDAVAPLLFNVVMEGAIRGSKVDTRGTMFGKCCQIMVYAADDVITGRRLQGIKDVFTLLFQQTNKTGLEINEKDKIYYSIAKALQ
jgi:sorting nexin-29